MTTQDRIDALIDEDLAALRSYSPDYDVDGGARRLTLATAAISMGAVGVGLGSSGVSGVTKSALWSLAVKALGLLLSTGSVALVALSPDLSTGAPEHGELAASEACLVAANVVAPPRAVEPTPARLPATPALRATLPTPTSSGGAVNHAAPARNEAFERDLAALERAKVLARANPELALEHAPTSGRFAIEHEIIAIRSLVRMNRRDEALARIDRFLAEHPNSPFGDTVRGLRSAASTTNGTSIEGANGQHTKEVVLPKSSFESPTAE